MFSFAYLFTGLILWFKLISYAHVNRDLRLAWRELARAAKDKEKDEGGRLGHQDSTGDEGSVGGQVSGKGSECHFRRVFFGGGLVRFDLI